MADLLNIPSGGGATSTFNSGFPLLDVIRKAPKVILLVDAGVEFNAAARATVVSLVTAIKTATRAVRGARVYPIMSLSNFEDKSKEPTKASVGNLSIQEITMQQGVPSFTFQHYKGELFHQQLAKAQNANLKLMIIDENYVLYGTVTSGNNLAGYSLAEFYVQLAKFATATDPAKYPFDVTLNDITEYKENVGFVQLDKTALSISGNRDVVLALAEQAANLAKITAISAGGKNMGDTHSTELAAVAAWVATNTQTGAAVTITGVTWDATNGRFNITVDAAAYGALVAGQKITINLASAAALSALGVDGFESVAGVDIIKA